MHKEIVEIEGRDINIKEWKGQRVVTFKDIDLLHERVEGTAGRCFRENKKKFIENEDYYNLTPENIKMDEIRRFGITSPRGGYLITESGYLMLVKSFTDDLSWKVQRQLVNFYFKAKEKFTSEGIDRELRELEEYRERLSKGDLKVSHFSELRKSIEFVVKTKGFLPKRTEKQNIQKEKDDVVATLESLAEEYIGHEIEPVTFYNELIKVFPKATESFKSASCLSVKLSKGLLKDIDFKSVKKGGKRFWVFKRKAD